MAKINIEQFRAYEKLGLITGRSHPTAELLIWNYTPTCTFERVWNEITTQARGLITTIDGTIVARPLSKFFNVEEYDGRIPLEHLKPFMITEKMDGSLGISFFLDGKPYIATRGSFTSEQAIKANEILYRKYKCFVELRAPEVSTYTLLFEIIYNANRIVVDYGDKEDLILLAAIHTGTGEEINLYDPRWSSVWPFPIVKHYDGIKDISELKALEEPSKEGFVIRFENGLRLKAKFSDYIRLHKLFTHCTARTVWEYLKEGKPLTGLLEQVPDDFAAWVRTISRDLSQAYRTMHARVTTTYKEVIASATIATPAFLPKNSLTSSEVDAIGAAMQKHIKSLFSAYPDIEPFLLEMHAHRRNKQYGRKIIEQMIWDSLYPEASKPFRKDTEA